jgi:hypothetical protein
MLTDTVRTVGGMTVKLLPIGRTASTAAYTAVMRDDGGVPVPSSTTTVKLPAIKFPAASVFGDIENVNPAWTVEMA